MKKTMCLAVLFAVMFVVDNQASAQATAVKKVTVDATKKAVDTGVKLDAGDRVEVTEVSGKVYFNKPQKPENATGIEGWPQFKPSDKFQYANATPSSLVGYIGDPKSHYQVRKSLYVEAKAAGNLFFAVNDQPASYDDNSGEFVVSYKIIKKDFIRSKNLGGRLNIKWTNKTGVPITVNWIDIDGKEMPSTAGVIKPNEDFVGETSVGHIFRVRDDKKAEICLIEVEATSEKVNIQK